MVFSTAATTRVVVLALLLCFFLTITTTTAQQAWTNTTTITCENGDSLTYSPAQGATALCAASNNIPCQNAIKMGYPNSFGPTTPAEPRSFTLYQQLTQAPLYIVISDFAGKPAYKTRFFPQVDRYSLLELGGTAGNTDIDVGIFPDNVAIDAGSAMMMNNTLLQAEFDGFTTPAVRRTFVPDVDAQSVTGLTNEQRRVVSFYTLIIELDRGKVSQMFWQDGCYGCGGDGNCWVKEPNPAPGMPIHNHSWCTNAYSLCSIVDGGAANSVSCNIKIYLAWQGTDEKGNYLMSAQTTIKNFLQFSLSTPFETANNVFDAIGPGAGDF